MFRDVRAVPAGHSPGAGRSRRAAGAARLRAVERGRGSGGSGAGRVMRDAAALQCTARDCVAARAGKVVAGISGSSDSAFKSAALFYREGDKGLLIAARRDPRSGRAVSRTASLALRRDKHLHLAPNIFEPARSQRSIARSRVDRAMTEIGLQRSGIDALVGQCVAAGVPKHVWMDLEPNFGCGPGVDSTKNQQIEIVLLQFMFVN
jgi:hypothetical protein